MHADTVAVLSAWQAPNAEQESLRQAFLAFLASSPDACRREYAPGHVTASALVLDATGRSTLLTLHPRVGRWLQLGGHCEPEDTGLRAAALREAEEESGIRGLRIDPTPLHLDVHGLTCSGGAPTRHFDVRYLVRAPAGARAVRSAESVDLQWWPVDGLPSNVDSVPRMVELALGTED
ncbi:8-oxo-dGTP pyrophosphatase MutT (NUDIX family) [Actinoalloteichus hoggarensis]|uniref:NUDIX domain protein n=2 Tax=Actinoalloteichus hoggarensis TaxID=1470176 RepID=A0A221WA65_9PSEU|nr:NUDIX domain protein [Actinoalloteichus hoggarensis]MBB5923063.1 8-oxo-dGTP pyrophosphatase MutT (NUDIX family) [Actinoalloteichus hoggarensis]